MFGMSKQAKPATSDAAKGVKPAIGAVPNGGDGSLVSVEVKLSPVQRDKLLRLGGDAWIRAQVDKARGASDKS